MLPIVDSNWSPASQDAATDFHILRAVAVQTAMSKTEVDSNLASLSRYANTPGLGGLPNGIAAYLDIAATDALTRIEEIFISDRVLGVNIVFAGTSNSDTDLHKSCIDVLASHHASIDISGDIDSIRRFLRITECASKLNIICNISQCSRADKRLAIREWCSSIDFFTAYDNVAIKITDPPVGEFLAVTAHLELAIQQLAGSIGIARILFGSSATHTNLPDNRNVWQYFDAATRRVSALERDQIFRENTVCRYRL